MYAYVLYIKDSEKCTTYTTDTEKHRFYQRFRCGINPKKHTTFIPQTYHSTNKRLKKEEFVNTIPIERINDRHI